MEETKPTSGPCLYCGRSLTRAGMSRHLKVCPHRLDVMESADGGPGPCTPLLHLVVRDANTGQFWLHLEADGTATLAELDRYLRGIWLECCGHLSRFSVDGSDGPELSATLRLGRVLSARTQLTHVYDFGMETVSRITVHTRREGTRTTRRPIALMARNHPPARVCAVCERPATHVCAECTREGRPGALCLRHARRHPHTDYGGPLPLTNSPRSGMCQYDGPAEPPY